MILRETTNTKRSAPQDILLFFTLFLFATNWARAAAVEQAISEPRVIGKGRDHRLWETVQEIELEGKTIRKTNTFTEIQTAMFRYDPIRNDLVETDPRIELFQDGAVIRNLVYNVIFAPNLASQGALDILLPDGQSRLTGQIMGLAFTEGTNSVLIAETKDCAAEITGPSQNILIYRNAFTDFTIDVQFQAERANFSQTVIFRERLPDPGQYGLSPAAHLELFSEWITAPSIEKETAIWEPAHDGQNALTDESINLAGGSMQFIPGKAFSLGDEDHSGILIAKSWEEISGRRFIVEKIPWTKIASEFQKLPPHQAKLAPRKATESLLARASAAGGPPVTMTATPKVKPRRGTPVLPPRKAAAKMIKPIRMADAALPPQKGLAWDWDLGVSTNSFTWKGGTTYYVSGLVSIQTNIFEGTVVVKFAPTNNAEILVTKSITCLADRYTPIFLTARDDRSVGESIGSSALSGYYAVKALALAFNSWIPYTVHDIRISHARNAFEFSGAYGHVASHIQLVHCETGLINTAADVSFRNLLAYSISNLCYGDATTTSTCRWENATFDQVSKFNDQTNCIHYLTNCLLVAVTNTGPYSGSYNASNSNPATVFQTVGASAHYLLDNAYRNSGTTNVSILADIQKLTTYPPIILQPTNDFMGNTNLVLFPQAMRDTDTPDLGAHLPPLDFIFGYAKLTNSSVLMTNGVVIGTFSPVAGAYGIVLDQGATLISEGSPKKPLGSVNKKTSGVGQ